VEGRGGRGPGAFCVRLRVPVGGGAPVPPAGGAAGAADFGNGISQVPPGARWLFINTDVGVQLPRPPAGEWIAVQARTIVQPGGVGLSVSTLYDERGPVGTGQQTLYVGAR